MNNPALEAFIEKVDREETEDSKETKDSND